MNTLPEPLNPKKDFGEIFSKLLHLAPIVMLVVVSPHCLFLLLFFSAGLDIGKTEEFVKFYG